MKLLQIAIVVAVVCGLMYLGVDGNGNGTVFLGIGVAIALTAGPLKILDWWRRRKYAETERQIYAAMTPQQREESRWLKSMDSYERAVYRMTPEDRAAYFKLAETSPQARSEYRILAFDLNYEHIATLRNGPAIKREWYFQTLPQHKRLELLWGSNALFDRTIDVEYRLDRT